VAGRRRTIAAVHPGPVGELRFDVDGVPSAQVTPACYTSTVVSTATATGPKPPLLPWD
jgi:hypothetical protein